MNTHPTDRLITGLLLSTVISAAAVVAASFLGIPSGRFDNMATRALLPVLFASCIVFPRPLLLKTVLRARRDPLLLDEDLNATLTGLALGLVGGFFLGITLCSEMF
jgi:hypothetical protein